MVHGEPGSRFMVARIMVHGEPGSRSRVSATFYAYARLCNMGHLERQGNNDCVHIKPLVHIGRELHKRRLEGVLNLREQSNC